MAQLIRGDALDALRLLPDASIDMVLTDPPYGTTQNHWDDCLPMDELWRELTRITKPESPVLLFGCEPFSSLVRASNMKYYKYDWYYIKPRVAGFLNAKKQPLRNVENVMVFYRKQARYDPVMRTGFKPYARKCGSKTQTYGALKSIVSVSDGERYPLQTLEGHTVDSRGLHPTQKPVSLLEYFIKTYTVEGETVLDFTMGSGSAGVACKNLNREFIGIELDPGYFKIARERIGQELTIPDFFN